jgi:RNA polymerase primary sigma factor
VPAVVKQHAVNVVALKEVQDLLALGKEKGFLTYDEINDALPESINDADSIDAVIELLGAHNIQFVDWVQ